MRAIIEVDEFSGGTTVRKSTEVDIGVLSIGAGHWACPRCGCGQFTAQEKFGRVVLSCFSCPTHIALLWNSSP